MKKQKKLWGELKLLSPKNLEKEVHIYGYHFSWKAHSFLMLGALAGISAVGLIYKLEPFCFGVILAAAVLMAPVLVLDMYKKMYEQKRFADAVTYMEQMLYSFQKSGKILNALRESREIFGEGQMADAIDTAVSHMEQGKEEAGKGILKESLKCVERIYRCTKITMVHELLTGAEEYGGETESSILLMLEDLELWKRRVYKLQADKKKSHLDNMISIAVAVLLCATALYVLDGMKELFAAQNPAAVFQIRLIQVSSTVFIMILLRIFVKSSKNLTDNWLEDELLHEPEYIEQSYAAIMEYDDRKQKKRSFLCAAPCFAAAAGFLFFQMPWAGGISLAAALVLLFQHKIGYILAKRDVTDEMYLALPQWLMDMALLLQNNNVQVSIIKSEKEAPAVLKRELEQLVARIEQEPNQLHTYTQFCKSFDLPEIQSCMKMLHAVSEMGTGNVKAQIVHLLQRVNEMQGMADQIRNEAIAFRMKMLFSCPVIAATAKLLVDLTAGMAFMFRMLGNIGGYQ